MADNDLMDDDDIQENMTSSVDTKKRGAGLIPMLIIGCYNIRCYRCSYYNEHKR